MEGNGEPGGVSIAAFALAEAGIAQAAGSESGKKAPRRRTAKALADLRLAPEPR